MWRRNAVYPNPQCCLCAVCTPHSGKLETALESVLLADGYLREHLVERYGFSVHRVRFSKDRRTAYILWDASPGKAQVSGGPKVCTLCHMGFQQPPAAGPLAWGPLCYFGGEWGVQHKPARLAVAL